MDVSTKSAKSQANNNIIVQIMEKILFEKTPYNLKNKTLLIPGCTGSFGNAF